MRHHHPSWVREHAPIQIHKYNEKNIYMKNKPSFKTMSVLLANPQTPTRFSWNSASTKSTHCVGDVSVFLLLNDGLM